MVAFFDSNVILYSLGSDIDKAERSDALLAGGGWISVQVLNEIANVSRRKMGYDWPRTRRLLDTVTQLVDVADLTHAIHRLGMLLAERFQLSVYDGLIVAAAVESGCDLLYSKDMHHGLVVADRLRIKNPFRA
jgi:predicted nucleic acid-binding protein